MPRDHRDTSAGSADPRKGPKCPICGKPTVHAVRPFCSSRCADIDLGRWVSGAYVIGGGDADADEDGADSEAAAAGRLDRGRGPDEDV